MSVKHATPRLVCHLIDNENTMAEVAAAVEAVIMPPIEEEEIAELHAALVRMKTPFRYGQVCLRCGYCAPCPQGIPIPAFSARQMVMRLISTL